MAKAKRVPTKVAKDPRSTQRKRARRILEQRGVPVVCGMRASGTFGEDGCGRTPDPNWAHEAYGGVYTGMAPLQVDHISKNIMDNDGVNLQYLCASCHRDKDNKTAKGVSRVENEYGY